MYFKIIVNTFLLSVIAAIQLSFVDGLSGYLSELNIVFVTLAFVIGITNFKVWFWWAFGFGFIFDIYSFLPFGLFLILFPLIGVLLNYVLKNYLTDRSLYSFVVLLLILLSFFEVSKTFFTYLLYFFEYKTTFYAFAWSDLLISILVNYLLVVVVYNVMNITTNILKPVFLVNK